MGLYPGKYECYLSIFVVPVIVSTYSGKGLMSGKL